ncbi:MAG: DUF885 domain-containing protein [Candidatus Eisenbacteria bacterium]|nr:DUF885 domain-containing protein [Candidatus Eisenbacteria bacterium]
MAGNPELQKLVDDYASFLFSKNPVAATALGVHTEDGRLGDYDEASLKEEIKGLKALKQRLAKIPADGPAIEQRIEHEYLSSKLDTWIADLEEIRALQKNPSMYSELCMYGIFLLMSRDFAPAPDRAKSVISRLKEMPRVLGQGKENVKNPPKVYAEIARDVTKGGEDFLIEVSRFLETALPKDKAGWSSTLDEASAALKNYRAHLEKILPEARGNFALGEKMFNFKLARDFMVSHDCSSLEKLGKKVFEETKKQMLDTAREIDPRKSVDDTMTEIKKDHPEAAKVKESYEREMLRAKHFVVEKDLVAIPEGETLVCIDTPVFERSTIPYAAYLPPGPFEEKQQGFFYVTPVTPSMPKEEQLERLKGHNMSSIITCSLHEAYPGHHLQLVSANRVKSKMRKLGDSNVLAEGWALYCEEMMYEQGFYKDPRVRLYQLKDSLWRAARIMIDVGIHTGKMSIDEAVDLLVNGVWIEKPNAVSEVKRYTTSPTQPSSYMLGKIEIMSMREDYMQKMKGGFSLKKFHQAILGAGTIPPRLIRNELFQNT